MKSMNSTRGRTLLTSLFATATVLLILSAHADADILFEGGGDINQVPMYRSRALVGIDRDGDGGFASEDFNLHEYTSNVAPKPVINMHKTELANGATMLGIAQAAYSGFYAGRNYSYASVDNANANDRYYTLAGTGTGTTVQFFSASAVVDRAVFNWRVSGTEYNPSGIGRNTGRLDFGATTDISVNWLNLFTDPDNKLNSFTEFGPGTYSYSLPIAALGTKINLFYWSSAFSQVLRGEATQGSSFTMEANYTNTFELFDVQLLDLNGDPISEDWELRDLNMNDAVVFNQGGRNGVIDPAPPLPTAVPEPGTFILLVTGLIAFGVVKYRRG